MSFNRIEFRYPNRVSYSKNTIDEWFNFFCKSYIPVVQLLKKNSEVLNEYLITKFQSEEYLQVRKQLEEEASIFLQSWRCSDSKGEKKISCNCLENYNTFELTRYLIKNLKLFI